MSTESQTRRLFLAAGSASAVFGALAQAAAASAMADDPIFAAIARHQAAERRYCGACALTDEVAARREGRAITPAEHAALESAERASDEALYAFLATPPATLAGVRALLRYCIDEESINDFLPEALETLISSPALAAKH